jgi:hypothetical protein
MASYEDYPRRRPPAATSGKAIFSLVLGIASFCLPCVAAVPALALGLFGLKEINQSGGRLTGKGMALAGMITGVLGSLCGGVLYGGGVLGYLRFQDANQRVQSTNDLSQIGIALLDYEGTFGAFPPSAGRRQPKDPPHSWRVAILPYIDQGGLYNQYNFSEPWDGPNNKRFLEQMPKLYALPAAGKSAPPDATYYQMFVGKATIGEGRGARMSNLVHGSANTLLVVEAAEAVPWTKPEDLPYAADRPLPRLGGHFRNRFLALFADGSVVSLPQDADEKSLRAIITYDDPDTGARERLTR